MVSEHPNPMAEPSSNSPNTPPAAASSVVTPTVLQPAITSFTSKFDPHPVSIKLTDENYLPWKQQAMATIKGYKLQQFLLGAHVIPSRFLTPADEVAGKLNEEFLTWEQQDQLLLSWLLASMSDGLLIRMVGCDYSFQVWEKLEQFFASQTKAKVNQLKTQLRSLKKGSLSATDYLLKIKKLVDSLFSVGSPLTTADHIEAILEGLPEEYNAFIVSITSRSDPYTVNEIKSLLVAQEDRIEKYKKEASPTMSANVAQVPPAAKGSKNPSSTPPSNQSSGQSRFASPQGGRGNNSRGGFRSNRGRGGGRSYNKPQCQVCGRIGHMAWQCFHRFNNQFVSPFSQPMNAFSGQQSFYSGNTNRTPPMQAMVAASDAGSYDAWYPDSGASNHITSNYNNLSSPSEYNGSEHIQLANGSGINISHIGHAQVLSSSSSKPFLLKQLLHVPNATKNLLSVSQFESDNKVFFEFHPHLCFVKCQATKRILLQGAVKDGLYYFDNLHLPSSPSSVSPINNHFFALSSSRCSAAQFDLWHCRLGHPSTTIVNTVLKKCQLPTCNKNDMSLCTSCCLGKSHRLPFYNSFTPCTSPLEMINADVWGPAPVVSSNGFQYYVHFIDSFTRFTWLYLIKNKSDVAHVFKQFKTMVELQFNSKIKSLQTDGGREFTVLKPFLTDNDIIHRISCPYTPAQNGIDERKNRHIVEMGLTLLAKASLPMKFWDEAFLTAVFLINRLPTPNLDSKSPYEVLFNRIPEYNSLKTFVCACFPNLRPYNSNKLEFCSTQCTFLGYSSSHLIRATNAWILEGEFIFLVMCYLMKLFFPFLLHL